MSHKGGFRARVLQQARQKGFVLLPTRPVASRWKPMIRNGRPSQIFAEMAEDGPNLTIPSFMDIVERLRQPPTIEEVVTRLGRVALSMVEVGAQRFTPELAPLRKVVHIDLVDPHSETYTPKTANPTRVAESVTPYRSQTVESFERVESLVKDFAHFGGATHAFVSKNGREFVLAGPADDLSYDRGMDAADRLRQQLQAIMPSERDQVLGYYCEYQPGIGSGLTPISVQ